MAQQCIVIGASAGGLEALQDLVSQLPADFSAPIFVVLHIPAHEPSRLPRILNNVGLLSAIHPADGTPIQPGMIYVAPPDHHLLIDDSHVAVKKGPKENGFRPSIDALFRSAAYAYGPGAIGMILSGALNDGASGLWSIKRLGGIAIVQNPDEALFQSMPRSALEYVEPDYVVPVQKMGALLRRLTNGQSAQQVDRGNGLDDVRKRMAIEAQVAAGVNLPEKSILDLGQLTPFTCPECRGVLVRITEGKLWRFRCHTGHAFTAEALLEGIMETADELTWQVTRSFQEAAMLLEHMGRHMQDAGEDVQAEIFLAKSRELNKAATGFQRAAVSHEGLSGSVPKPPEPVE